MTLKVIHRLQAFSNAICQTLVQHFARFQLTLCSRGPSALAELLYGSEDHRQENKFMLETQKVDNNQINKALFVNIYVHYVCNRYTCYFEKYIPEVQVGRGSVMVNK